MPTPSAAPTASPDQLPPRGRAGGGDEEFDEEFDAMEDDWDEEENIEREMLQGGEASEIGLLQRHNVVGETDLRQASAPRRVADPPLAARPSFATATAGAICKVCTHTRGV